MVEAHRQHQRPDNLHLEPTHAAYRLTLLSTAALARRKALVDLQVGNTPEQMLSFEEMKSGGV